MMKRQLHILEDDAAIRDVLNCILEDEKDLEVSFSTTLRECRIYLATHCPKILLVDLRLPDGNGLSLCEEHFKKSPATVNILMSAATTNEIKLPENKCIKAYLEKPFDITNLVELIRST